MARLSILIIQFPQLAVLGWEDFVVCVSLHPPCVEDDRCLYHSARQVGGNSILQMAVKDCDLSNDDDFYSLKIRAHCFLVLIRNSLDAAAPTPNLKVTFFHQNLAVLSRKLPP